MDNISTLYINPTPTFILEQQQRYTYMKKVSEELLQVTKHFNQYVEIGQKLIHEFQKAQNLFDTMEIVNGDAGLNPLRTNFAAAGIAFQHHFEQITSTIVKPLNKFVANEIDPLQQLSKSYEKTKNNYDTAKEKYLATTTGTKNSMRDEKFNTMVTAHTLNAMNFFDLSTKIQNIELQMKYIVPNIFIEYLNSIVGPYNNVIKNLMSQKPLFKQYRRQFDKAEQDYLDFSQNIRRQRNTFIQDLPVFWKIMKSPFEGTTETQFQGFLYKKSNRLFWHRRFVMVNNGILSYAKSVDAAIKSPKIVMLLYASVKPEKSEGRYNCFSITTKKKTIVFQALTQWEVNMWINVLQNNIMSEIVALPSNNQDQVFNQSDSHDDDICADCGALGADWCSLNWGITLCNSCVSIHRSLPSSVTIVRSLKLDDIHPLQRILTKAIGTEMANKILEANVGDQKISPSCPLPQKRGYIQRKYIGRQYVAKADDVDIYKAISKQNLIEVYKYIAAGELVDLHGFTPVHAAAIVGNPLIMELICLNTHQLSEVDEKGWTPLSYAAFYKQVEVIEILLENGAKSSPDSPGNPWYIAKMLEDKDIEEKFANLENKDLFKMKLDPPTPGHTEITPQEFNLSDYVDPEDIKLNDQQSSQPKEIDQEQTNLLHSTVKQFRKRMKAVTINTPFKPHHDSD